MRFDEHFVRGVLPQLVCNSTVFPADVRFCVDTRILQEGDIFVALPGAVHDGHAFIADAFARGAAGVIVAEHKKDALDQFSDEYKAQKLIMRVPDTLDALVRLARAWRSQFSYPVIGVTGSVGKTSTKQMISAILTSNGMQHMASFGNQNTKIGIALNMLRMRQHHTAAVFEVGINQRGEMASLAEFLRPTTAIVTNIGHAHMEGLGSLSDIALEKRDIFKYFNEDSIGIINGDQLLLTEVGYNHPVIKFGSKTINQVQARKITVNDKDVSFVLKLYKTKYQVTLRNSHVGMVYNALAASAVAYMLSIPVSAILQGIQQPREEKGRFNIKHLKSGKGILIDDCYNANPESMKAALLAFEQIQTKAKKVAILGDMLELGETASFWHRQIGRLLHKISTLHHVILVGDLVQWTKKTAPLGMIVDIVPSWKEAVDKLNALTDQETCVLVKASNGMQLSKLVQETANNR